MRISRVLKERFKAANKRRCTPIKSCFQSAFIGVHRRLNLFQRPASLQLQQPETFAACGEYSRLGLVEQPLGLVGQALGLRRPLRPPIWAFLAAPPEAGRGPAAPEAAASQSWHRGSALLAVLWLAAGLSAIAFSVATTVRGETERTSTTADATRAYYLAAGSIDRAILWRIWGLSAPRNPDGTPRFYQPPMPYLNFDYASGRVVVEVIPESGKLNINNAASQQLFALVAASGVEPGLAQQIAAAIVQWRTPGPPPAVVPLSPAPPSTFPPRHASFQELEEILLVPGMTPELFYGHYTRDGSSRLIPRGGLKDALTVYGSGDGVDVNTAPPALLLSLGIGQDAVNQIVAQRQVRPFKSIEEVQPLVQGASGAAMLRIEGNTIWTLRATARLRLADGKLGDVRRSVAAVVKYFDKPDAEQPYQILRWYDDAWSPTETAPQAIAPPHSGQ